ncbi:MAG: hypothetical protein AVO38_04710 [delta proteobacterium ML8_D]|jgi:hypothetical protein|nr:MAG: hypothetical protein AVO38_04710 [delta proteobacterium ML8_D]
MRIPYLVFMVILTLLSASCDRGSIPSESDAREFYENQWKSELEDGTIKIIRFDKTNGEYDEVMGIKFYELAYEAEIENLKGERDIIQGNIVFQKKIRGWKAPDGKFY